MIWITSDLHFCHAKEFLYKPRGFECVEDMNKAIVENWNSVVSEDDDVYLLGDVMLSDNEEGMRLLRQLHGKIHLIYGNHDTTSRKELYKTCENIVEACYATQFRYNGLEFYLSHYPTITSNWDFDKPLKYRVINLCGHSHTKDKFMDWDKGLIYHCELDAHENFPKSLNAIAEEVRAKYGEKLI